MVAPKLLAYKGLIVNPSVRREIERHPSLDEQTEKTLLLAAQSGDIASRQKLVSHNLAWICKVGGVYKSDHRSGTLLNDDVLLNQGVIGLTHAIEEWSPDGGARLGTFAYWHIRKAMQSEDALYADNTIRIPESARNHLRSVNRVIEKHNEPITPEEIAEQTQLKVGRVKVLLKIHQPSSLDVPVDHPQTELVDRIADPDTEMVGDMQEMLTEIPIEIADAIQEKRWGDVLKLIPARLAEVIRLRFLDGATFKAISRALAIPTGKVGAVVTEAIEALRTQLLGCVAVSSVEPEIQPIVDSEQLPLEQPISEVVETGRKLLKRGLGFGVQFAKITKRAVQKVAQKSLHVFTQSPLMESGPTTYLAQTNSSAHSTSVRPWTEIVTFEIACHNIVDFKRRQSRGAVSPNYYSHKEFDSGG